VALLAANDSQHERCVEASKHVPSSVLTCWPVITEAAYLLKPYHGAVAALLTQLERNSIQVLPLTVADASSVRAILGKYHDQGFDFADACLMHLAEREQIHAVFTLDRRHFSVFRLADGTPLQLLPNGTA
jgi:predicted nucleic acid-binding protein